MGMIQSKEPPLQTTRLKKIFWRNTTKKRKPADLQQWPELRFFYRFFFFPLFFFKNERQVVEPSRVGRTKKKRRMFSWVPWVCLLFRCAARPGIPPLKYLTKMNINYRQISIRLTSTSHHPLSRCLCGPTDFFVYKKKVIFSSQPKRACSCTKSISFGAEDVFLASFFLCAFSDFQSNFFSYRMRWHQFSCPAVPFDPFSTSNREKVRLTFSDNAIS